MATKANRIQFKDVRQGKTLWLVRPDFTQRGEPVVREIRRIVVAGLPYKYFVGSGLIGTNKRKNQKDHFVWMFNTINSDGQQNKWSTNLSALLQNNSRRNVSLTGDYNLMFTTKKAAEKYAEEFLNRTPNKEDLERTQYIYGIMEADMDFASAQYEKDMAEMMD